MGLQETKIQSLPFVTAELNYLAPVSGKPRTYAYDPPPGEPKSTNLAEPHLVPIFNGRSIAKSFSLDREGFELVKHPTAVKSYYDEDEIRRVYYPAVEAFLRATLKAERVFIFDHTVRRRVEGAPDIRGAGPRQPATRVHVDQTVTSGANRVREHLPDEAEELLKGRVQVINLWRPIRGPLRDSPSAKEITIWHASFGKMHSEIHGMAMRPMSNSPSITNTRPVIQSKLNKSSGRRSMNFAVQFRWATLCRAHIANSKRDSIADWSGWNERVEGRY